MDIKTPIFVRCNKTDHNTFMAEASSEVLESIDKVVPVTIFFELYKVFVSIMEQHIRWVIMSPLPMIY